MTTTKVAVTIDRNLLAELDRLVTQHVFPNRSKAIQAAVEDRLTGLRRTRLARECVKMDPQEEQRFAEEGMDSALTSWPKYCENQPDSNPCR